MKGSHSGERLLAACLERLLKAGTLATSGVVLVLGYGRKLGKNDLSFSKMRPSP